MNTTARETEARDVVFAPAEYAEPRGLGVKGRVFTPWNALICGWHVNFRFLAAWDAQLRIVELVIGEERE